ncbi:unnamed protein product, partial [Brenthis ino]
MAPNDSKKTFVEPEVESGKSGDRVFITGMSGLYPESKNVKDLSNILYNKINPVNAERCRWQYDHPEVAKYTGKVPDLSSFDAQFFKVHYRLGNNMDAMGRKILEQAYQAIFDAGISPVELSGKKVGVYVGSCFSETEKACFYVVNSRTGFGIAGCSKTMFANRISYWLNAKGPSMAIDEACCSSTCALEQAYLAISRGECDAAIVGGANLCLHPQSSVHYGRIMKLSMDGKTKSFDNNPAGCSKSESINVLFLQKAKEALRVYAEVAYIKCEFTQLEEDETGPKYGFYRNPNISADFIKKFYQEADVSPDIVEYVEAVGSAVAEADRSELQSIDEVFCKNRSDPLKVGSVMSNIGYTEAASGICAITKVLLAYHTGKIAANLHCDSPRQDVAALRDGRMCIVTDHMDFSYSYTAVNGLSVTGVNSHVLLKGHYKPKDLSRYKATIPQLVTLSGRQESSVVKIINDLKTRPVDPEELALLRNIHKSRIFGHLGRGYTILDTNEEGKTISLCKKSNYFDDVKRPLWFMYSGMGSQWAGMGTQLMRIPVFAAAIERCRRALEPKGIDIVHIITSTEKTIFNNILHSFVGIAAIQIGLTDVLKKLEIYPDMIIGHSVGELGCAYADGCFTAEEMILSAYNRGLVSLQTPFIRGSMAAVGVGYQQIVKMCPPEIEVACHNGPDSSTISGPATVMKEFVDQLTSKGIFAKEVPCSNIAYHSRYIAEAGPGLLKYLTEVIKSPKPRSEKWVSTSVPKERWGEEIAKYSSAEYHTNNLLNPVLFEETSRLIPANAVVIEIAPHGLLQAIVKRSLPDSCRHIPLTRRGHVDNALFLLEAIGKLYMDGFNPKVEVLYPKIEYPVSTGTPMLSHLVEWAHNEKWTLPLYASANRKIAAATKFLISTYDNDHAYLKGHVIREKNLYPFSGALVGVWDTLAMVLGVEKKQLSVKFTDINFFTQPILLKQRNLRLNIALHRGNGRFEVLDESTKIVTGYITGEIKKDSPHNVNLNCKEEMQLKSDDIYKLFSIRDYNYSGVFRSIYNASLSLSEANIKWEDNWVAMIDSMLQLNALRRIHETVSQPHFVRKIVIDVKKHFDEMYEIDGIKVTPARIFDVYDYTRCGGIIMQNIRFHDLPTICKNVGIKALKFVPHFSTNTIDKASALSTYIQISAENLNKYNLNIVEIIENSVSGFVDTNQIISEIPGIKANYSVIARDSLKTINTSSLGGIDLMLVSNLSNNDDLCQMLHRVLTCNTFVVNYEKYKAEISRDRPSSVYQSICAHTIGPTVLELVLWRPTGSNVGTSVVTVNTESDFALLTSRITAKQLNQKLVILTSYPPLASLKTAVKKWRKEDNRKINLLMINNEFSSTRNLDKIPLTDLAFNILHNGAWGGEYYLPAKETSSKEGIGLELNIRHLGDLDSLHWTEVSEPRGAGINVKVHFAGVNFVEVQKKMGVISCDKKDMQLFDFSGTTDSGARVMGIANYEYIRTHVSVKPEYVWPVPAHWTMEDAATVPLAYCLALYCLCIKARLKPGITILVHGGAGAFGQAVISIALAYGCKVFTTVSDVNKKRFLRRLFPELKESHIGNSRDTSFGDMVLYATKGDGCDLIVSFVKGALKDTTIQCCRRSGTIIDTTLLLTKEKYDFGMKKLAKSISYSTMNLFSMLEHEEEEEIQKLHLMLTEGIARGYVRPLSRVTYSPQDVSRAYSLQAGSRHRGRVLLDLQKDLSYVQTKITCSTQLRQLVISENELLALKLVDRLVSRGARKIILVSSTGSSNCRSQKLRTWTKQGVQVQVIPGKMVCLNNIINLPAGDKSFAGIEGIYYIVSGNAISENSYEMLEQIKLIPQRLCSNLKYFAIINDGKDDFERTVLSKVDNQLLTWIKLPALQMVHKMNEKEFDEAISAVNAIDAIEKAICLKQRAILIHSLKKCHAVSLVNELSSKAGISIPDDIPESTFIADLDIEPAKLEMFRSYLHNTYHIFLDENSLPTLTIKSLRQLEDKITEKEYKESKGFDTFLSNIDNDELLATTEMVFLPTLINSSSMREDEFDVNQTYLCVVPGIEGLHSRFKILCERLKLGALVLQPGLVRPDETIQEMADRFAKTLIKKAQLKDRFYLLGYESGVMVALEMAAILEDQGITGTVFCIGGAPNEVQAVIEKKLEDYNTEEELQNAVIRHMFSLVTKENIMDSDRALQKSSTWAEKLSLAGRILYGQVMHSNEYMKELINAAYARIVQARCYNAEPRQLQSLLISIRPSSTCDRHLNNNLLSLQNHSVRKVVEYQLESPFAYAAYDLRCSAIVNHHLDENILEAFDKRNLCESYITNSDSIMSLEVYSAE